MVGITNPVLDRFAQIRATVVLPVPGFPENTGMLEAVAANPRSLRFCVAAESAVSFFISVLTDPKPINIQFGLQRLKGLSVRYLSRGGSRFDFVRIFGVGNQYQRILRRTQAYHLHLG